MRAKYTIRGDKGHIQEGDWHGKVPELGARVVALPYGLEGVLLFLGSDQLKEGGTITVYVRFLHLKEVAHPRPWLHRGD